MKYVNIPHTDLRPSCLCLGSNRFGTVIDQTAAFALLDAFVEVGGNFIDTALNIRRLDPRRAQKR